MPSGGVLAGSTFLNDPARKIGVRQAVEDFMRNQRGAQILETQDHVPPLEGTPCALDTRIEELRSSHGIQVLSRQCGSCLLSRLHTWVTETIFKGASCFNSLRDPVHGDSASSGGESRAFCPRPKGPAQKADSGGELVHVRGSQSARRLAA